MSSFLREKVSKNKRRYKQDGFDLDLTYITDRIIAMGFPSSKTEAVYRNPLPEVYKFFEHYHKDYYKLYNLCAERKYDITKFHSRVSRYPFYDHNAPPVGLIQECCQDIYDWLEKDPKNVVGINCKAGKGRTGLIICCYLLHNKMCKSTEEALTLYGHKRTKDGKGVTIASQIRYIRYYERVLSEEMNGVIPDPPKLVLTKLIINYPPKITGGQFVWIERNNELTHKSNEVIVEKKLKVLEIPVEGMVHGDCKIQLAVRFISGKKGKLCHFWFNTGFVHKDNKLTFEKSTIDVANKDRKCKVFRDSFSIEAQFRLPNEGENEDTLNNCLGKDGIKPKKKKKKKKGGELTDDVEGNAPSSESEESPQEQPPQEKGDNNTEAQTRTRGKSFYSYDNDYNILVEKGLSFSTDDEEEGDDDEEDEKKVDKEMDKISEENENGDLSDIHDQANEDNGTTSPTNEPEKVKNKKEIKEKEPKEKEPKEKEPKEKEPKEKELKEPKDKEPKDKESKEKEPKEKKKKR